MAFLDSYQYFIDSKFDGIQKFNESCSNNVSSLNKIIRIFKDYYIAQDNYTKAISKMNINLAQLSKNKSDCFYSIIDALSTTFCVFTNVQKEFTESLYNIIKNLTTAVENNQVNLLRVITSNDSSVVTNFKNLFINLERTRQKYQLSLSSSNFDQTDKSVRNLRTNYEMIINKYNTSRDDFYNIMVEGFSRCKQYQFSHLEIMRKCVKNVANSLAKLILDMRESVDSLKRFYRLNSNEDLFQAWIDSNKTVDDNCPDPFPVAFLDYPEPITNESQPIDSITSPSNDRRSMTNTPEMRSQKKIFQSRRSTNIMTNGDSEIYQELPPSSGKDINSTNKKNENKNKSSKRRWSGFTITKKFQSANDLVNVMETKVSTNEDCWQLRTNLNENVIVDKDGFIIRDSNADCMRRVSRSSSSNSSDANQLRKINVNIRPVNMSGAEIASKSEIMNIALQLPLPHSQKSNVSQQRRVSHLQRSSRHVSQLLKDRYYRRSVSVSELRCSSKCGVGDEDKHDRDNPMIPIACAMTEALSSDDGGYTCTVQGQMTFAFPLSIKEVIKSLSMNSLPHEILLELVTQTYDFSTVQIMKQYEDVATLEKINQGKYNLVIQKELLERISTDVDHSNQGTKISFPLIEYAVNINRNKEESVIECFGQWAAISESYAKFDFRISSRHIEYNKFVKLKIQLLSEGTIENVVSNCSMTPNMYSDHCWTMEFGKSNHSASVIIKHDDNCVIRLKFSYEFVFEKISLVMPHLLLRSIKPSDTVYKISLIHYRTISIGNFSQLFVYNIS